MLKGNIKNKKPLVLDLFSGCGGFSLGLEKAGFKILAGVDNWKDSLITFEKNHTDSKAILLDLSNFRPEEIEKEIDDKVDIIIGGPPCQGFSISGKRNPDDLRNTLYKGFVRAVSHFNPKVFVLENVPNLVSISRGEIKDRIIKDFSGLGYDVKYKILLASNYGVPQNRRRVIFIGVLGKNDFEYPREIYLKNKRSCFDALGDLPENSIEDGALNRVRPKSEYQKLMRFNLDKIYNHEVTRHSERTVSIIGLVPDGGNYKDLPEHLRETRKVHIAWTRYNSKKPSLTIDTGHRHHFHYHFNRIPTVRESARLQSFPDDFIFYGSKTSQYKQVGNAVPPLLAESIGIQLIKLFK